VHGLNILGDTLPLEYLGGGGIGKMGGGKDGNGEREKGRNVRKKKGERGKLKRLWKVKM
jgi:hypothetical protein